MFPAFLPVPVSFAPQSPRAFEWRVWRFRWLGIAIGIPLFPLLDADPLWVPFAALGGLVLHNGFRLWLLKQADNGRFRMFSRALFGLDAVVFLVALWPLLRGGEYPVQLLSLLLLVEAAARFGCEPVAVALVALAVVTLALIAFELLGLRYHESLRRALLWSAFYAVYSTGAALATRPRQPTLPIPLAAPPEPPLVPAEPSPPPAPPSVPARPLTPQQRVVLAHLAAGLTRREIADRMHLDLETVNSHIQGAYRNLGAHGRADALARARALGVLDTPDDAAAE